MGADRRLSHESTVLILVFERFTSTRTRLSSIRTFSSGLYGINTGYEKISIIRVL